jgi:hypothetical protein
MMIEEKENRYTLNNGSHVGTKYGGTHSPTFTVEPSSHFEP